jgi:hypothetical protein
MARIAEYPPAPTRCMTSGTTIIWITKYRYKMLRGRVAERARDLSRQVCEAWEVVLIRGAVSPGTTFTCCWRHLHRQGAIQAGAIYQGQFVAAVAG